VKKLSKYEARKIPMEIDYVKINNLTKEAQEALNKIKPISLGQARRIKGVSPTDIQVLNRHLDKNYRERNISD